MDDIKMENIKEDKLQKINVPKIIKTLSVVYIALSIITGLFSLISDILSQGHATANQAQYVVKVLSQVLIGFIFWGIGQVFEKFMESKK